MTKKRRIVDLSYALDGTMMVYPGLSRPILEWLATYQQDGHWSSRLTLPAHVGTHIDAPKHFMLDGESIDQVALEKLVGEAVLVDLSHQQLRAISAAHLQSFEDNIRQGDIVILNTGTYKKYNSKDFITSYPYLTLDAAEWLVERRIACLGVDMMAIDPLGSKESPAHHVILGAGIPIVENLAHLDQLDSPRFLFIALPLKVTGGEGAPCRAIAVIEEE